ncbi:hypothetical protein A5733_09700 [Mycobacterium sp. NS-7484]|uniref:hypothetical protein n=1 Tax=Mycobacterium sp. NS-7484 TaxID=1834161 RepID=UPI00096F9A6F|nr:hypothetical protein [Mycobacterium sp. NS-7484]OMB97487.1 hypothetical protein A5733_09700 [Mycobacterium sp. NS-7484]
MIGKKRIALVVWLLGAVLLAACSTSHDATKDRGLGMQASAETATEFGDVNLPPTAEVLAVDTDASRDTRYRLAFRTSTAELPRFLSQFGHRPQASKIPRRMRVIGGPELSEAPNPLYAQDRVTNKEGQSVTREVIVDERATDKVYVHLSMYTT